MAVLAKGCRTPELFHLDQIAAESLSRQSAAFDDLQIGIMEIAVLDLRPAVGFSRYLPIGLQTLFETRPKRRRGQSPFA